MRDRVPNMLQSLLATSGLGVLRPKDRSAAEPACGETGASQPGEADSRREEASRLIAELNAALSDLRRTQKAASPAPVAIVRTGHLRQEICRMANLGLDSGEIARQLRVLPAEVELLVKVNRLSREAAPRPVLRENL